MLFDLRREAAKDMLSTFQTCIAEAIMEGHKVHLVQTGYDSEDTRQEVEDCVRAKNILGRCCVKVAVMQMEWGGIDRLASRSNLRALQDELLGEAEYIVALEYEALGDCNGDDGPCDMLNLGELVSDATNKIIEDVRGLCLACYKDTETFVRDGCKNVRGGAKLFGDT